MNFSKKPQKQHHSEKFQKSSILFTQLGLILALLIVYLALEFTSVKEITKLHHFVTDDETIFVTSDIPVIFIEKNKEIKNQINLKKLAPLVEPKIVSNDTETVQQILDPIDFNSPIDLNSIPEAPEDPLGDEEPLPFIIIEEAPIFPGCEGLDSIESKKCFTKQISKYVKKKFNTGLAEELGLKGKQKIYTQFIIDKDGKSNIIFIKAPHKRLEKEVIRIVKNLPQMTPGKQRKKPVPVKYTLPILFHIN